jgi:hypothetical protein
MQTVDVVLNAFEANPHKVLCNDEPFISYPKYLPKYKLLPLQVQDPKFCVSLMLQLLFLFESFKKPVSVVQKRTFTIGDSERRIIDQATKRMCKLLSIIKNESFEQTIKQVLQREDTVWATWKESKGCSAFEKEAAKDIRDKFNRAREKAIRKMNKGLPQKLDITFRKVSKSKTDKMSVSRSTLVSDFPEVLGVPVAEGIPENPYNPLMGDLMERVFMDLDPEQGIEKEYRAKNDPVIHLKSNRDLFGSHFARFHIPT